MGGKQQVQHMLRYKPQHTPSSSAPTTSLVVQVRDWLAILTIIAGAIWAAVVFYWDKLIAPQFEPAIVQISGSSSIVGRTDCCVLVEVETKLYNSGRRDAFIHASHIAAGAKKVDSVAKLEVQTIRDLNAKLLEKQLDLPAIAGIVALDVLYGAAGPTGEEFLLLGVGNLISPGTQLTPGESFTRRMALIVPSELSFVSLRAAIFVAHSKQASPNITWNWVLRPKTVDLQIMPWRTADLKNYRDLTYCGLAADTHGKSCRDEVMSTGKQLWTAFLTSDRYAYIQPYSVDFMAWRPKEDHAPKR